MEDKSSNVRKAAMQLVMTLLQYNPFGPVLDEPRLVATLSAHAAKLQVSSYCRSTKLHAHLRVLIERLDCPAEACHDGQGDVASAASGL